MYTKVEISEKNTTRQVPNVKRIISSVCKERMEKRATYIKRSCPLKHFNETRQFMDALKFRQHCNVNTCRRKIIPQQCSKLNTSICCFHLMYNEYLIFHEKSLASYLITFSQTIIKL